MGKLGPSDNVARPAKQGDALACEFDFDGRIEAMLRDHFLHVLTEPIPDRFQALLAALGEEDEQ